MGRVIELQINYPDDLDVDPFKFWSVNSLLHREDGFAVYYGTGAGAYYLNGKLIADERFKHVLKKVKMKKVACSLTCAMLDGKMSAKLSAEEAKAKAML